MPKLDVTIGGVRRKPQGMTQTLLRTPPPPASMKTGLHKKMEKSDSRKADFLQVPRSVLYVGRFVGKNHALTNPRHRLLLLVLQARQFKGKPIRAYWKDLGRDLGVASGTVRKWAYVLRDAKLLGITNHKGAVRGPDDSLHWRNESNTFSLAPFQKFVDSELEPKRTAERGKRRKPKVGEGE